MSKKFYFILFAFVVLSVPFAAHAATSVLDSNFHILSDACYCDKPITANGVTVQSSAPGWGCILATFQNVLSFVVALATMLITVFIALAGFTYMTSGGSAEKRQLANKRIMNAVIGLLIVLCSYLLVDSVMKVVYNPNAAGFGPWNSILGSSTPGNDCLAPSKPPSNLPSLGGASGAGGNSANTPQQTATVSAPGASGVDISKAVAHLDAAVVPSPGNSHCALWVRNALDAGGFNDSGHPTDAKDYGPFLTGKGFSDVGGSDGSPQAGDIVVIQNYPGGSVPGHIAMFDGSTWVSDFVQSDFWGGPGYRKYQPAHEFYRP